MSDFDSIEKRAEALRLTIPEVIDVSPGVSQTTWWRVRKGKVGANARIRFLRKIEAALDHLESQGVGPMSLFDAYPDSPGHKGTETSAQAARDIKEPAKFIRARVLSAVQSAGDQGVTPDEFARRERMSILSARPRFSELKVSGQIKDSGIRRLNENGKRVVAWVAA